MSYTSLGRWTLRVLTYQTAFAAVKPLKMFKNVLFVIELTSCLLG